MTFTFRPARRENVSMIVGLIGGSGSGKTMSAMRLASGICGDEPFAVIDTEAGRAKHYADQFRFDHGDLIPPFRPERYVEAIQAADRQGYKAIIVDSVSHVWAGEGGILDWHEEELHHMAGQDWKKRESCKMAAWIKPKMAHKAMVQKLLQVRAHLILCFRAEEKLEMVRDEKGKMQIVEKKSPITRDGWAPICEKQLPFELTASFLMLASDPGVPLPIKLQRQHRLFCPENQVVTEDAGRALARWAAGGDSESPAETHSAKVESEAPASASTDEGKPSGLDYNALLERGWEAAHKGTEALKAWWTELGGYEQKLLTDWKEDLKAKAAEIDRPKKKD